MNFLKFIIHVLGLYFVGFKLNDLFFNVFVKFITHKIYHLSCTVYIQCFLHYNFYIKFNYLQ